MLRIDLNLILSILFLERYPSKPYIKEGFPGNITVLINHTAILSCPPISDLEPHTQWYKIEPDDFYEVGPSDRPIPPSFNLTEVYHFYKKYW